MDEQAYRRIGGCLETIGDGLVNVLVQRPRKNSYTDFIAQKASKHLAASAIPKGLCALKSLPFAHYRQVTVRVRPNDSVLSCFGTCLPVNNLLGENTSV